MISARAVVTCLILAAGLALAAEERGAVPVTSFESEGDLARWTSRKHTATIERAAEHATGGKYSARVTFLKGPGKYTGLQVDLRGAGGAPVDWSRFRGLRVDVYNPFHADWPPRQKRSDARIIFTFKDARGNSAQHRWALSPWRSEQTMEAPLETTMEQQSALGKAAFDPAAVVGLAVSTHSPKEDLVLFLDNMRLVPKDVRPAEPAPSAQAQGRSERPLLGRDFLFTQQYSPGFAYEEKGLFRLGRGPVVLRLDQPEMKALSVPELVEQVTELRRQGISFQVILFNFWYGRAQTYEEATTRLREAVVAVQAAGGDLFQGVWLHELSAVTRYKVVAEREKRIDKANAYVGFLRRFIADIHVPPGKLILANQDRFVNFGLDYEAGVDAVLPETLFRLDNLALCMAQARGMAGSFHRWWGGDTARYGGGMPPMTRYNRNGSTKLEPVGDFSWWRVSDVYKAFIQHYYSGADILRGQSEWPDRRPEDADMMDRFLRFVEKHPRAGKAISRIAAVRSKGDYWVGASNHQTSGTLGLADWMTEAGTRGEEWDFLYLNTFFPGFAADDNCTDKSFWTGTPYGPIDIVYPSISLHAMKEYDVVIFMGFHRMDSVRPDFLADLTRYVEGGGTVLLAADQLRMSDDKFAPAPAIEKLTGVKIAEKTCAITGPIRIAQPDLLALPRQSYELAGGMKDVSAYEVVPRGARVAATDAASVPLFLDRKLGKGHVFLLTTPVLSTLPPRGKNDFISDLVKHTAQLSGQPITISPPSDHVEFLLSKAAPGWATLFLMNHEREPWRGDVTADLGMIGPAPSVSVTICRGYEAKDSEASFTVKDRKLTVRNLALPGAAADFDPFRAASFVVITIDNKSATAPRDR